MSSKAVAALVAGAMVIGLFVGLAVGGGKDDKSTASGAGPTKVINGVPVGYERSRDGAIQAALGYLGVIGRGVELQSVDRKRAIEAMTLASRLDQVTKELEAGYRFADERFGLSSGAKDALFRNGVLGYRVKGYDNQAAEVEIWEVVVAGKEGAVPAGASWERATIELRWAKGDWKLAATSTAAGPSPRATDTASETSDVLGVAKEFEGVRYAPAG